MNDFQAVFQNVKSLYSEKKSLRRIAKEDYGGRVNHAAIERILHGQEPKEKKIREVFGLPPASMVIVIGGGEIPEGAQVISASMCECGQWYISNSPNRKHCFICRPFRKKKVIK